MNDEALQGLIRLLWEKNRPLTRDRLASLQRAAKELGETRSLAAETRTEATGNAHKLAGSLGMFGYMDATKKARDIELLLTAEGLPQPEQFEQMVQALCDELAQALTGS